MCGLTGFVTNTPDERREAMLATVATMAATLTHRGPDDGGEWVD